MATEQQSSAATAEGGVATGSESLTVTDNRTGRTYELPITDGTVRGLDLRQIKVDEDEIAARLGAFRRLTHFEETSLAARMRIP